MKLTEIFSQDIFIPQLRADTRDGAIQELLEVLVAADEQLNSQDYQQILQALIKRETDGSTGFGKGVAVPHCQHLAVKKSSLAIGRSAKGLDFNASDKAPVYSVLLLLSPADNHDRHLQAMELIFSNLQRPSFRKALRQANTANAVLELIAGTEDSKAN